MRTLRLTLALLLTLVCCFCVPPAINAQDEILINYQGHLTDDAGAPVTGNVSMTMTIYDATGSPLWTETHPDVTVTEGRFMVVLGSAEALPDDGSSGRMSYLGIQVGEDPEISPRTLLTSVLGAASSRRLVGDVETGPGGMVIKNLLGDSATVHQVGDLLTSVSMAYVESSENPYEYEKDIELLAEAGTNLLRIHPPDPCVPPDPCTPALELIADAEIHSFKIYPPDPCVPPEPCYPSFDFETGAAGVSFKISDGSERMGFEPSPFHPGYSLMMYDPSSATPTTPKFDLHCGSDGTGIDIWDDIGKVMGTEPSPFNNGYAMRLFDPTSVDGAPIVEISSSYGDGAYGKVNVGWSPPPDDSHPGVELTSTPSMGKILVGGADPGTGEPPPMIVLEANAVAKVGIGTDTPSEALHVVGNVYVTGEMYVITDTKAKTNVVSIVNALDKVGSLNGVTYDLQGEIARKMGGAVGRQVGLLAQDVEQVLPEAVKTMNDGYKAVDYSRLTAS